MDQSIGAPKPEETVSRLGLWLAVGGNLLSFILTRQFFSVAPGARIRPMGWVFFVLIIGMGELLVLSSLLLKRNRLAGKLWFKFAIALCLTPVPLAFLIERIARRMVGYSLSP